MTKDPRQGPEAPEEVDPLSATAMFLRTFDRKAAAESKDRAAPETGARAEAATPAGRIDPVPSVSSPSSVAPETHGASPPTSSTEALGEFTRLFVRGAATPASKNTAEASQTPAQKPSRLQGFSTPGASDAAAADHDFTQFFKAASKAPGPSSGPPPSQPPFAPGPVSEPSRKDTLIGEGSKKTPAFEDTPASVTSLIASLSSSQELPAPSRASHPEPYRPQSLPAAQQSLPKGTETAAPDSAGVTRLIQRLSEPAPVPALQERPGPAPVSSVHEAGEFTRMVSKAEGSPAIGPQAGVPAARPAEPIAAAPRIVPAIPPASVAPPVVAVPAPTPKLPTPAAPVAVAPKGKLDAMVPMLLVINTFLLLVLLIAVLFLIKSR